MDKYELRALTAEDVFPMSSIISKIGIKEFRHCFESEEVKNAINKASSGEQVNTSSVGVVVALELAGILMTNLPKAKDDILSFLAQLSGMTKKEVSELPMATFAQMVIDVVKKDDFADFFQVVSRLFK